MTIYRLHNDINHYSEAYTDLMDLKDQADGLKSWFSEENEALTPKLKSKWQPPAITFHYESKNKKKPDLTVWDPTCLIMSSKAKTALNSILSPLGEFLELQDSYHLYNCLASVSGDTADPNKTRVKAETPESAHIPESLSFIENKLGNLPLFKPGFLHNSSFLCNEEFKHIVEQNDLGGLILDRDLARIFSPS